MRGMYVDATAAGHRLLLHFTTPDGAFLLLANHKNRAFASRVSIEIGARPHTRSLPSLKRTLQSQSLPPPEAERTTQQPAAGGGSRCRLTFMR